MEERGGVTDEELLPCTPFFCTLSSRNLQDPTECSLSLTQRALGESLRKGQLLGSRTEGKAGWPLALTKFLLYVSGTGIFI